MTSETDSGVEGGDRVPRFKVSPYPLLNDIDFDMDTTEYEIYRDYIDDAEDDRDPDPDDRVGQ